MAQRFPLLPVLWIAAAIVAITADPTTPDTSSDPTTPDATSDPTTPVASSDPTTPVVSSDPTAANASSDPATTPQTTTIKPPGPCVSNPCGFGSACEARANESFECLCWAGDAYNYSTNNCYKAKVFPLQIALPEVPYVEEMNSKTSQIFKETSTRINEALAMQLSSVDAYGGSIVHELSQASARAAGVASASVEVVFGVHSEITTKELLDHIKRATTCPDCVLKSAAVTEKALCERKPCDASSTACKSVDGLYQCDCMQGYINTPFTDRMCNACPSGFKAKNSTECVECAYGRSGFDCTEEWKLLLTIIGSVLGGLLLITLILLPIVALKSSKKSSKKNKKADTGNSHVNHAPAKAPLANSSVANSQAASCNESANGWAFPNAGVPRIPRATTNSNWDSRTNLEMAPSNSRQNLIPVGRNSRLNDDRDDMNPYIRPQNSLYDQAVPQNIPYAQSRSKINPYDDGRRY